MKRENTNIIRGIYALIIMYTHIGFMDVASDNILSPMNELGYIAVGGFFFYTGYNLFYSYTSKIRG